MGQEEITRGGPVPLYIQVAEAVRKRIASGEMPVGRALPSKAAAVYEFGIGEHTWDRAVAILREEGLVRTTPGLGIFVVRKP